VTTPGTDERVYADLERFIGSARWFGGKGRDFRVQEVRRIGVLRGEDVTAAVELVTMEFADGGEPEIYQLPLSFRAEPEERLAHAVVGFWDDPDFGPSHAYDAVHDRDAMALWLSSFTQAEHPEDPTSQLLFHRVPGFELDLDAQAALLSAEQSNSSVAFGEDSLMKVFRRVTPGINPDIQIHEVLTRTGSEHIAALYGWLDCVAKGEDGEETVIQLAMLQQFLRTASDGFEVACASVRNLIAEADLHAHEVGGDFASESERLGGALAEIHQSLASSFPTETRGTGEMAQVASAMHERLRKAVTDVPPLARYADGLGAAFDRVGALTDVPVQRIHGDLHLGQTLRTVRNWKIVDFEGEPAKQLRERLLPDPVWRDVAGMLRSFDYAAAIVDRDYGEGDPEGKEQRRYRTQEWTDRNRRAFLAGYVEGRELTADEQLLLDAYEVDKAVYECVYEARNRPDWIDIPLAAIARLAPL
jgi:maltokinase